MILETERLQLRSLTQEDYHALCMILQDAEVMYAYEHAFSDAEVHDWLNRQLMRYQQDGFGLWAVLHKDSGRLIGQAGITYQDWNGRQVPEIGYLFQKAYWHQGYATEAAMGCKKYAFEKLGFDAVYSIIRDTNSASKRVALRNGMEKVGSLIKYYYGIHMPHDVYCIRRQEKEQQNPEVRILIDADGCPVVDEAICTARTYGYVCIIFCDTSHVFKKKGAVTITVDKGADSADFKLVNLIRSGDIVVTQDYGLAAMCLARGAVPISQNGMIYNNSNIDSLLESRYMAKKIRAAGGRLKGPAKRTPAQDAAFRKALRALLEEKRDGPGQ